MFIIREATQKDAASLLALIHELAVFEREPHAVIVGLEKFREYGWGGNPRFRAWVAEAGEEVIGMALCYDRYSTWKGPVLYLEDLVVQEKNRQIGAGKALFETCLKYARDKGYARMSWQVLDWNEPAIKFYEKYGSNFDQGWVNVNLPLNE